MSNFIEDLKLNFYVSFIYEDRWIFFRDGLIMTLILTVSSFILGSLFGALLCAMKLSKSKALNRISTVVSSILTQLPTLVLLMAFVYIIFGQTALPVIIVAIFGLTLKAGSYMSEIFYTAITSVAKGEVEAAQTLGLSKLQTFRYVILPQAIDQALPVYKNQFIITLQETSVVGYIAIMDLTRASDIITARTMDAMFGLIVISILYLIIGWIGGALLNLLRYRKHLEV